MDPEKEHPLNTLTEQVSAEERSKIVGTEKALRTLEGDIREAIEERNASVASVVVAQQAKTAETPAKKQRTENFGKKAYVLVASIVLVALGVGGAYYLYIKSPLAPSAPAAPKQSAVSNIITPDSQRLLDVTGFSLDTAKKTVGNALSNIGGGSGSIMQIIPVKKTGSGNEGLVGANDFLTLIGMPVPDILFRSLSGQWMLGTYNDGGTAAPFIILRNNFFQNAYAGMITWEKTMPDDLATVFGYADKAKTDEEMGTSTLSSYFTIQGNFKDGVIENKDVRDFVEPNGTVLVLYSFVDNDTIVITTDGNALAEVINRIEKQTYVR